MLGGVEGNAGISMPENLTRLLLREMGEEV